jgi:hypothetical protein
MAGQVKVVAETEQQVPIAQPRGIPVPPRTEQQFAMSGAQTLGVRVLQRRGGTYERRQVSVDPQSSAQFDPQEEGHVPPRTEQQFALAGAQTLGVRVLQRRGGRRQGSVDPQSSAQFDPQEEGHVPPKTEQQFALAGAQTLGVRVLQRRGGRRQVSVDPQSSAQFDPQEEGHVPPKTEQQFAMSGAQTLGVRVPPWRGGTYERRQVSVDPFSVQSSSQFDPQEERVAAGAGAQIPCRYCKGFGHWSKSCPTLARVRLGPSPDWPALQQGMSTSSLGSSVTFGTSSVYSTRVSTHPSEKFQPYNDPTYRHVPHEAGSSSFQISSQLDLQPKKVSHNAVRKRNRAAELAELKKSTRCYYCKQNGHWLKECRLRPRNNK